MLIRLKMQLLKGLGIVLGQAMAIRSWLSESFIITDEL